MIALLIVPVLLIVAVLVIRRRRRGAAAPLTSLIEPSVRYRPGSIRRELL